MCQLVSKFCFLEFRLLFIRVTPYLQFVTTNSLTEGVRCAFASLVYKAMRVSLSLWFEQLFLKNLDKSYNFNVKNGGLRRGQSPHIQNNICSF